LSSNRSAIGAYLLGEIRFPVSPIDQSRRHHTPQVALTNLVTLLLTESLLLKKFVWRFTGRRFSDCVSADPAPQPRAIFSVLRLTTRLFFLPTNAARNFQRRCAFSWQWRFFANDGLTTLSAKENGPFSIPIKAASRQPSRRDYAHFLPTSSRPAF
jgi:hypothetical protein